VFSSVEQCVVVCSSVLLPANFEHLLSSRLQSLFDHHFFCVCVVQYVALCCCESHCIAVYCSVLQFIAVCCNVLPL